MYLNRTWKYFLLLIIIAFLAIFFTGRLEPLHVFDTVGYIDAAEAGSPEMWAMPRTPFFGLFLNIFDSYEGIRPSLEGAERTSWENNVDRFKYYPFFAISLYFISSILLFYAFSTYGLNNKAASSISFGLIFSNSLVLYGNNVHPELLSISLIIFSIAGAILMSTKSNKFLTMAFTALCVSFSYLIKPAFITFFIFTPLIYYYLDYTNENRLRRAMLLFLLCSSSFFVVSIFRYQILGDFNIVSFGGYQMTGIAGLMVDKGLVLSLPIEMVDSAKYIIEKKDFLVKNLSILAIPQNSIGEVSFVSAALGYFDILARNYDSIVYGITGDLKMPNETWVEFNSRMQRFSVEVISSKPLYYFSWIVGASARFVGRVIVINLPLMLSVIGIIFALFLPSSGRKIISFNLKKKEIICLIIIPLIYTFSSGILSILVSFPASRYIDTSGIMLSGFFIFVIQLILDENSRIYNQ